MEASTLLLWLSGSFLLALMRMLSWYHVLKDLHIVTGSFSRLLWSTRLTQVFDLDTFECIRALAGHIGAVYAVCVSNQRRVFSGSYDSTIKVWSLENSRCIQTLKRHTSSVEALVFDGEALYSASSDNSIKVFS